MYPQDFVFIFHGFLCVLVYGSSISHTRRGLGAGVTQVVDFDCPEEFGYYPHPTDCTQYYVCVFGGALLESCTGGLMYSHELQTCDWPRNVGCGESGGSDGGTISTVRVTDPRTRNPQQSRVSTSPQQSPAQVQPTRSSHRQEYNRPPQQEVIQQQLYAEEDLGPAEELESDRQQRVYRGQPSSIGQVQRDRDGLRPLKNSVHSQNIIPTGPGNQDKISVVSFGSQRPSAPRPQEQYRLSDLKPQTDDQLDAKTDDNLTETHSRRPKRQIFTSGTRTGQLQTNVALIPYPLDNRFNAEGFLLSPDPYAALKTGIRGPAAQALSFAAYDQNKFHVVHPIYEYFRPQNAVHQHRLSSVRKPAQANEDLLRLTKSTIQSEFRPIIYAKPTQVTTKVQDANYQKLKYIETIINPLVSPQVRIVPKPTAVTTIRIGTKKPKPSFKNLTQVLFAPGNFLTGSTERPEKQSATLELGGWRGATKPIKHDVHLTPTTRRPVSRVPPTTPRPKIYGLIERPKDYDLRWLNLEATTLGKRNLSFTPGLVQQHHYAPFPKPQEYEDEFEEIKRKPNKESIKYGGVKVQTSTEKPFGELLGVTLRNMSFFDFIDEVGFRDAEEIKAAIKKKIPEAEMDFEKEVFHDSENRTHRKRPPLRYRTTATTTTTERPKSSSNQIEAPRKRIPEEYYENFKPSPTKSFYLTRRPDDDGGRPTKSNLGEKSRVEQVQPHQLTSTLPPLSPSPRPIERYNTSQRYQANPFDQYYTVYDDGVEIYRSNDYSEQFQTPSSTPSSNIAQQYRGQTTYKQTTEVQQQQQQQQQQQEPLQQQQHRNTYSQDLYSPPPVLQDFNDQYNVQIEEQQYQQIAQPTAKPSSRSETTNSSKDALTESSISVTRVPENATTQTESSPITRRSDSNSYFSISSVGPSTVLLPPFKFADGGQKFLDTTYPPTPKPEKPRYSDVLPSFGSGVNFEPPKNGGTLAKTFNSFDSLLSSFIAAVTKSNRQKQAQTTTPPTPQPPKTSPETIVRSEIGRIHHDPIVITENFKIRQPTLKKPEVVPAKPTGPQTVIASIPSLSSTPVPLNQDDYLAYFVEIEPKKPKHEEFPRGFFLTKPDRPTETTTEPKIITKDTPGFQEDQVAFNLGKSRAPFKNFVRLVPNSQSQNVQLGTTLDLEPIDKPQEKKKVPEEPENETIEKQKIVGPITTVSREPFQSVGKWVIAKNESPQPVRFQNPKLNPFEIYSQERQKDQQSFRGKPLVEPEIIQKQKTKEVEAVVNKGRGNLLQIHANPETTVVSSPYKFLLIDLDSTTEQLSTPSPFSRNPENEDRNRFLYKTNPESRVRPRYFDNTTTSLSEDKRTYVQELNQVPTETTPLYSDDSNNKDSIKFTYKTNPENRFKTRYLGDKIPVIDDETPESVKVGPKNIVPQEKPVLVLEESPIQVLPEEETKEQKVVLPKRRKPEFRPKNVEIEPSPRKPLRFRSTTEAAEVKSTTEELRKLPRRVVKIFRNDLKNQRLVPKFKRPQKPAPKSPIVILEDLEEKALNKENEIHPTYRPIIVSDGLDAGKNRSRFRFTVEEESDFTLSPDNKINPYATTEKLVIDAAPRGFGKPGARPPIDAENDVPEVTSSEKPLFPTFKRPQTLKNVTQYENRATTKGYRGKFKPSDSSKLRLRPTTASPDSESTPGPHLSTRQPGGYSIGSTGNEVTVNRGTPAPNRGTRPTLKPSTAIVSKASEFIDIYRYPPRRPQNIYATPTPDKSAAKCRKDVCLLPDCNCGGKDIPAGYNAEEIPQLVLLTFDDSVNDLNKGLYAELFERGRVNPNGCPISATFYVSHEWTDYSQVQNLYANGHEIASHSITHSFGEQFSQKKWTKEIAGQREILAAYGGVRLEDIRGMRAPFLAVGGNKMFKMLYDSNFTYDSSMPIYENRPPSWPYTLDYKLFHDCMIPPCPTKSYPGVWEVPMVMWQDLNGGRCSMGDACSNPPTADGVYKMLIKNFERHFTTNRAPFGLYYHAAWFTHEHHKEGFIAFLDTIVNMPEVWLVTSWQAIEWVRDPQPLSTVQNFPPFQCNVEKAKKCNNPKVCNLWHKSGVRYMRTCQPCPEVYPWTGKTGVKNSRVDNEIIEE